MNSPQNLFYKLNNNSEIIEWAKFSLMRLERLNDGKRDRKFVPGVEELTAIKVENSGDKYLFASEQESNDLQNSSFGWF